MGFFGGLLALFKPTASSIAFHSVYQKSLKRLKNNFTQGTCAKKRQQYSFFVAGHVYGKMDGKTYNGIYKSFKNNNKLKNCAFMPFGFLLGDTVKKASNYEFNTLKNDIKFIGNKTDIYIAPGNHDIGIGKDSQRRDIYVKHFGKTFKYIKYKKDLFILLDSGLDDWNISGKQLQMLKNLNSDNNKYNNVFVFSHHIIWFDSNNKKLSGLIPNSLHGKAEKLNFWNEVFPIIKNIGKNVFVFAGDVGASNKSSAFFYDNIFGVDFFATGMGGGKRDNFLLLHIDHGKVNIELVKL